MSDDNLSPARPALLVPYDRFLEYQRQRRHRRAMARVASETPDPAIAAPAPESQSDATTVQAPVQPGLSGLSPGSDLIDATVASPQA